MSKLSLFAQVQGLPAITEIHVEAPPTEAAVFAALVAAGLLKQPDMAVFIDETEKPLERDGRDVLAHVRSGARVHVVGCRRIKVAAHYQEKTAEADFPPGTKVRTVKAWAVRAFKLSEKDAAEHVLQICKSTTRPPSDMPLQQLTRDHECSVCFDLVPEKRVEG